MQIWEMMLLEILGGMDCLPSQTSPVVFVLELDGIAASPLPALEHSGSQAVHTNTPVKDHWATLGLPRLLGWSGGGLAAV